MYEKEKQGLSEIKKVYDEMTVPEDKIIEAIHAGFQKAKAQTNKKGKSLKKKWLRTGLVAAVLTICFVTGIRISPAFAQYIATIPCMEKLVEFISHDKGLMSAIENEYLQEVNISQEKNALKVTLDSLIADERGLVLFQTIEAKEKQETFSIEDFELESADGVDFQLGSHSYGTIKPHGELRYKEAATMDLMFEKPLNTREFIASFTVKTDDYEEVFRVPFTIEKPLKATKTIELNKTVTIEEQKITIKNIKIYPLRVAVHVVMDEDNSKKILAFEDIRLVDENGESWTKIANGITAQQLGANEHILYLQSNYFKEPKKLYLVINKLQAVDKDEAAVIVDPVKQQILKQPKGDKLKFSTNRRESGSLSFTLDTKEEFKYSLFINIKDADGKEINYKSQFKTSDVEGKQVVGVELPSYREVPYKYPLELELSSFPTWIEGDVKINVK